MRRAAIHPIGNAVQSGILFLAALCAGHANALESARASGDAQKTKPFGKLSLSLSLTLSTHVSKPTPLAGTVKAIDAQPEKSVPKEKTLGDVNAEIAAIEEMIQARQRQLDIGIESTPPQFQPSPATSPSPFHTLPTPVDNVSAELAQGVAVVAVSSVASVASDVGNENSQPKIVAPNVRPVRSEKITPRELHGMDEKDWAIALVVPLLAAFGFVWYRRRKAMPIGEAAKIGKPGNNQTAKARKEPKQLEALDMTVAPASMEKNAIAGSEPPQKQQSILPPEYEMLEEADIYLRFGHDKLAEEALREAIKINPRNPQAYLTLLRIYFSREDSAAFFVLAQQLKSLGDESVWSRVAEMGRNLDSDNPFYR